MTQGETQRLFARHSVLLLQHILDLGFEFTWGEAKRSDEQAEINALGEEGRAHVAAILRNGFPLLADKILNNGKNNGIRNSGHQLQMALDLNLFRGGLYLPNTEDHRPIGEWWEKQHVLARWGGRWGDGNHYSFEFNGVK